MNNKDAKKEYDDLEQKLSDPELLKNQKEYGLVATRAAKLGKILEAMDAVQKIETEIASAEEMRLSGDPELKAMAEEDIWRLTTQKKEKEALLKKLTTTGGEEEPTKIIMEIRAGAGGDEAALFAAQLFQMYTRFAESKKWRVEIIDQSPTTIGGIKEAIFELSGDGVWRALQHESGVHRVQRVPDTEKIGRIHTSTASVAVLPEAKDVDMEVKPEDVKVEFFRSSGPGGQNVNKVETAVRLTHIPTGLVVASQEGRSQAKNREHAMTLLKTRLLDARRQTEEKKMAAERREQIGTADRSEKIRTYNFPQDRITDHRIKESWHHIHEVLAGNLDPIVKAMINANQQTQS
ncbi:MAG: peptide chain release factor 1 [bacterium]|nr:peptide chain release factor 1 [bacterium]